MRKKYICFKKEDLINLRFSLSREVLNVNSLCDYSYTTILGCNTRKYHGLLVCNIPSLGTQKHVMLSALDVSVIQHNTKFELGLHKYPEGIFHPKGHKFVREYSFNKSHKIIYQVGGVVLQQERIFESENKRVLIKYTIVDSNSFVSLSFKPFLAFRNFHTVTKKNDVVNKDFKRVSNGISVKMYEVYPNLFLQFSKRPKYIHKPDWYLNLEYQKDQERGNEYQEDLYVPGDFTIKLKKGESVIFSGGLKKSNPKLLEKLFKDELKKKPPRDNFLECISAAGNQFIEKHKKSTVINAGFPWFGPWGRDTLISAVGLTLSKGKIDTFEQIIKTLLKGFKDGLIPNTGSNDDFAYNSVDSPFLFFYTMWHYSQYVGTIKVWKTYKKYFKSIIEALLDGKLPYNIRVDDNGLIYQGENSVALTWMDAIVDNSPITQRKGYAVEINALWYHSLCFSLEMAEQAKDTKFVNKIKELPKKVKSSFLNVFWNKESRFLADCADYNSTDFSVRPNQLFAVSLPYSMLSDTKKIDVIKRVESELLTTKGLRTLSPKNINYKSFYGGNMKNRDSCYHQGTVWPWLLKEYAIALSSLYGKGSLRQLKDILFAFEKDMFTYGIGTVPEIYDGDPPHSPKGAVSQAWSIGALLWIEKLIKDLEEQ